MKVVFSPRAVGRLRQIQSDVAKDNVAAAARVASHIRHSTEILSLYPLIGYEYQAEVRRLNVTRYPYSIFYRVDSAQDKVFILTILHGKQKPPVFVDQKNQNE